MALHGLAAVAVSPPLDIRLGVLPDLDDLDDPESITLEHGEATVRGARGTTLYAQWWRPCGPSRGAVAVVHGLKDHSARYSSFAERLVHRGFAVHAFDLRGHGRSEGPRGWVDSFDDYVADLHAAVACMRGRERDAPLFVLGHGMGGAIAALWGLETEVPLAGLVLSGASLQAQATAVEARSTRLLSVLAPRARIFQLDVRRACRDRRTVEDSLRDALVDPHPACARTAKELLDAMQRIEERAPELEVPLLVLHGSADVVSDPAGSRRFFERAASVDKQLYVYDGLAHDLLHEPERARVMKDTGEWLRERSTG